MTRLHKFTIGVKGGKDVKLSADEFLIESNRLRFFIKKFLVAEFVDGAWLYWAQTTKLDVHGELIDEMLL